MLVGLTVLSLWLHWRVVSMAGYAGAIGLWTSVLGGRRLAKQIVAANQ